MESLLSLRGRRLLRSLTPFRDSGYRDEEEKRAYRSRQEFGTFTVCLFARALLRSLSLPLTRLDREGFADAASNWWWKNTLVRSLTTPLAPSATAVPDTAALSSISLPSAPHPRSPCRDPTTPTSGARHDLPRLKATAILRAL